MFSFSFCGTLPGFFQPQRMARTRRQLTQDQQHLSEKTWLRRLDGATGAGATTTADLTNCAIRTTEY
ncbi:MULTISPECIES: hypothetical protein [unclassified Pseudomonas]|uniref:hypothetical protein n=1 Tax=unclassified Pseudomonas TaxID=196821 RepID=UPI001CBD3435|nr:MULTISPECIES: hypothetical protein [unclassified Pseudomonas]